MADMDTAAKRLSALDWDQPWNPGIPIPDGADSQSDRMHGLWTYNGVTTSAPVNPAYELVYWEGEIESSLAWAGEVDALVYWEGEVDTSISEGGIL